MDNNVFSYVKSLKWIYLLITFGERELLKRSLTLQLIALVTFYIHILRLRIAFCFNDSARSHPQPCCGSIRTRSIQWMRPERQRWTATRCRSSRSTWVGRTQPPVPDASPSGRYAACSGSVGAMVFGGNAGSAGFRPYPAPTAPTYEHRSTSSPGSTSDLRKPPRPRRLKWPLPQRLRSAWPPKSRRECTRSFLRGTKTENSI